MATQQSSADAVAELLDPVPPSSTSSHASPSDPPADPNSTSTSTSSPPLPPPAATTNGPTSFHTHRLRRGMKAEDAYPSPFTSTFDSNSHPKEAEGRGEETAWLLNAIESPFQVQEYIALLVRADPHNVERIVRLPERPSPSSPTKGKAPASTPDPSSPSRARNSNSEDAAGKGGAALVNKDVWIYEQLRRFSQDLSHPWVTSLQEECTREGCPEMKAGEWLYLCAAHATANENECCAVDYIVHTLDGATALLNSARYFPSRMQIPQTSLKHFGAIARRLYRIFAHCWYHHREVFEQCETETSLYARFLALVDGYGLMAEDLIVIPRGQEFPTHEE